MKLNVDPLLEAIERYIAKTDDDLEEQLNEEGYVEAGVAVAHMGTIEDGVTAAVENNVDEVLARLQSASGVDDFIETVWPEISNSDEMEKALHDLFYQQFDELLHRFTKQWIISADPELGEVIDDGITKPAEAFIKGWSQQLANLMHLNTKDGIEKILLDAQEQKQTIDEVAQAIADSGIRECGYRSRRVAVTEVLRVEEYAHQEARIQNPSCYKKERKPCSHKWAAGFQKRTVHTYRKERRHLLSYVSERYVASSGRKHKLPLHHKGHCGSGNSWNVVRRTCFLAREIYERG